MPNCIYYGAPGTGKSYSVSERIKEVYPKFNELNSDESKFVFRTTLHPEYTYSDFVGQLMPVKNNDSITYEFTPGIFTLALKQAITNPDHYVFLVLEELSRANVASVFGDLFQLLDRAEGVSEYSISNPLIANFVYHDQSNNQTSTISNSYIYLPSNFVLLGTVNTNDQNVFVMDTAFKRRFEWEYVSTDAVGDNVNNPSIEYQKDKFISWWDFYKEINRYITVKMKLGEDKQIGQFFIKFSEDNSRNKKLIQNKLLQYLWEDVEKASYGKKLFSEKINSFSDLYKNYEEGLQIFSDEFINRIELSITHLDNADLMVAENNIGDISYDQRDK
ncbi:AAA domain-containing protein [Streptococcus danieliae]|uniref:AAA domain-containing protein n=1 Tax=Streptococcus danieliae TaxID=747656 RepID=A0A7X3GB33_9STRE|nr:AAA domain-containing protein [Streptococcus danieliae]